MKTSRKLVASAISMVIAGPALAEQGVTDAVLFAGGNIPTGDCAVLEGAGVDVALPTGTTLDEIVAAIRGKVQR